MFFTASLSAQPQYCDLPTGWFADSSHSFSTSVLAEGIADDTLTGDIGFGGGFIIDATLTIQDADVAVAQGHLIIEAFDTLRLYNSLVTAYNGSFWEGILIRPGGVLIMDSSTICYADEGVLAEGSQILASQFTVSHSRFDRNYIGLRAENYAVAPHPGQVYGTTFRGGALPFSAPGGITNGSVGVWIDSVSDRNTPLTQGLILGDTAQAANHFDSLDFGIYAVNSSLFAQNNRFYNIQNINGLGAGYGIQLQATGTLRDTVDLIVGPLGSTPAGENRFTDCRFGVAAQGLDRVKISGNRFGKDSRTFRTGIYVSQASGEISIGNNVIDTFSRQGIWLDDNDGNDAVAVFDNAITSFETPPSLDNTGIQIDQPTSGASLGIAINGNTISGTQRGIVLLNVDNDITPVRDNTIDIRWVSSGNPVAGIALFGVDTALVEGNRIRSNCTSVPCTNQDIYGIYTENSTRVLLRENRLDSVGYGALIAETSTAGNANCNVFTNCGTGFGFKDLGSGAIYGPVYGFWGAPDTTTVSDNAWFPAATALRTICFGATGTGGLGIFWSYRALTSTVPSDPSMISMTGSLNTTGGMAGLTSAIEPDSFLSTNPWCNDTTFMLRSSGHDLDGFASGRLNIELRRAVQAPTDPALAYLYPYVLASNREHPSIQELQDLWGCSALQNWEINWSLRLPTSLPDVAGQHPFTDRLLDVYGIMDRTPTLAKDPGPQDSIPIPLAAWYYRLTADDLSELTVLAIARGQHEGPAVYTARALLNVIPLSTSAALPEVGEGEAKTIVDAVIPLWPNPASDVVHAMVPERATAITIVRFDGTRVFDQSLKDDKVLSIPLWNWSAGLYHIQWTRQGRQIYSQPFMVVKP